jgi:glycosyltransferase involved in cell wall biosynthesis
MVAVSVILPTFNRTGFLRSSIESVYRQTMGDWQMIVADDGSGEETRSYLRGLTDRRVRVLWLDHCGNPSQVRNRAIRAAEGRYLAFLDSDDVWVPSKLEKQTEALNAQPERRWSYTWCSRIDESGHAILDQGTSSGAHHQGWIVEPLIKLEIHIAMPTVMAERQFVAEIGGFDQALRFGEYHDLCVRLAIRGQVVVVEEALCAVRSHEEHYSADRISAYQSWVVLYGKMADLAPTPSLRAHCRGMRARTSLILAGLQGDKGDGRGLCSTIASASLFSWRYPSWWFGALKALARPALPASWLAFYRGRDG